ncbi:GntR family transcriptional regulator [Acrocarpospora pleiomorpha]|uniref:GntR family transcriptional regulator n=1 Tax=Acrocarpospora pleiomorpha TaxID=90975 RepID=A0A5M3XYJ9_9ACTN|nr:GntR family transcriptional regulator [Acrocarpospora pleiomorpha]GES26205.1 GntR family transcriptional regulator [Acrocarpospora pleiomorpha]
MSEDALNVPLLHAAVMDRLVEMIVRGELRPGQRLYEIELCERLGVSRSPLREAIRKLAADGLLHMEPRRGAVVAPPAKADAAALYACRELVQIECTRLAMPHLTEAETDRMAEVLKQMRAAADVADTYSYLQLVGEFRGVIDRACGNKVLIELVEGLWRRTLRFRYIAVQNAAHLTNSLSNHEQLLAAIRAGDTEHALELTRRMINASLDSILKGIDMLEETRAS